MKLTFMPTLKDSNGNIALTNFVFDNLNEIAEWYDQRFDSEYENNFGFKVGSIKVSGVLTIEYDITDPDVFDKSYITDPDDDGNYPIYIQGRMYLVYYSEPIKIKTREYMTGSRAHYMIRTKKLRQELPGLKASEVSRIIRNEWNNMTQSERDAYENRYPMNFSGIL